MVPNPGTHSIRGWVGPTTCLINFKRGKPPLTLFCLPSKNNLFQYFPANNRREHTELCFMHTWHFFGSLYVTDLRMLQLFNVIDKRKLTFPFTGYTESLFFMVQFLCDCLHVQNHTNIAPFSCRQSCGQLEQNRSHYAVHLPSQGRN
jgi:hypothetical protein